MTVDAKYIVITLVILNIVLYQYHRIFCIYGHIECVISGAFLCGIGFISAMIVGVLDVRGMKELGVTADVQTESKKLVSILGHGQLIFSMADFWRAIFVESVGQ